MKYTALVPVKSLDEAKSRLAAHLTLEQRAALMLEMLHHVLCTLRSTSMLAHVSVVSSDQRVLEYAERWGAHALQEQQAGHNPALTAAALQEIASGSGALLTISADLPLLQVDDIEGMLEKSHHYPVVLASSQDGTGTNAILMHPPLALPYLFGIGSLPRYEAEAKRRQLSSYRYASLGLALDIDTIDDITQFQQYELVTNVGCH